jgi:tRNA(fMet)-specific endonuclease VapC
MRYLLDTNAVIGLLKETASPIALRARTENPCDIGLSSIVAYELYYGAYKSQRQAANLRRLDAIRFEMLPFDKEDAIAAGEVRATLGAVGSPIGPYDVLIAGQAKTRNLILVTGNIREFERVKDLRLENWASLGL